MINRWASKVDEEIDHNNAQKQILYIQTDFISNMTQDMHAARAEDFRENVFL